MFLPKPRVVVLDCALHYKGGKACSDAMVFMRNWGTKKCHDAITRNSCNSALIAMHGIYHEFDNRMEKCVSFLSVQVSD